jgi:integrase
VKSKGGADVLAPGRLHVRSVPRIVKRRLYMLLRRQEADKAARKRLSARDLKAKVDSFSSHSMRAGHVTDASERGVPDHHIMRTTGHKTRAMLGVYSRVTDAKKKSSLRGAGL